MILLSPPAPIPGHQLGGSGDVPLAERRSETRRYKSRPMATWWSKPTAANTLPQARGLSTPELEKRFCGFTIHHSRFQKFLDGHFVLTASNEVAFKVPEYDRTRPLIIDPVLTYSTYLGGSGDENPYGLGGVAVDASGSAYVTAYTQSTNFPIAGDAYQSASSTEGSALIGIPSNGEIG